MRTFLLHILMVVLPVCLIASVNNQPEIKLIGAKDRVLPTTLRTSILEVAEISLNRSDEAFIVTIEKVKNPYSTGEKTSSAMAGESTSEEFSIVYDHASILELIQVNFATQVRGTLAKGDNNYLQLNGGGMLEAGDSFPVQIPQIEGRSFMVTIFKITSRGYTLKMNDVEQEVIFEKTSGITKDMEK
jgi:hypothetical protein